MTSEPLVPEDISKLLQGFVVRMCAIPRQQRTINLEDKAHALSPLSAMLSALHTVTSHCH